MKYRILVTPPKAKKMSGKLVIRVMDGYKGCKEKTLDVGDGLHFDFEMPDNIPWIYSNVRTMCDADGERFDIKLVYSNKEGTKEEVIRPVPEELK